MSEKNWTVRRSRHVLRDRWISVRADDCYTPAGVDVSPYYVLEYRDFVHVLALDQEDQVVLARQYRHGLGEVCLELPGGIMDAGEADPIEAAIRELREETGFSGGQFGRLATLAVNPANFSNRLHLVGARGVVAGPAQPDTAEEIEVVLVARAEARRLALSGAIMNAQHVGLLLLGLSTDWGF